MSVPSAYTEAELQAFMLATLRDIASVLAWTGPELAEAVTETLISYGVDDIADATDIQRLRAHARVQAWTAAADALAAQSDYEADGGNYKTSQMYAQALKQLAAAQSALAAIESAETASTRPASTYLPNKAMW
jgi:basic membrane lipoprotein Med (substrate-binding protein (PBP1-ABC) superfamily)